MADPVVPDILIVGGGVAGGRAAAALRELGFAGRIELICAEPHRPYDRPPLSKAMLTGTISAPVWVNDRSFYDQHDIAVRLGATVAAVRAEAREVVLEDGTTIAYGSLILATGGLPRALSCAGRAPFHELRTYEHALALAGRLAARPRVAVIGGGFIGLEVASAARTRGCEVHVLEAAPRLLSRSAPELVSRAMARVHHAAGVRIMTGAAVERIDHSASSGYHLHLAGNGGIEADLVISGIGMSPDTHLAEAAGLEVADGVLVDQDGRSSDSAIFAIGDCARSRGEEGVPSRRFESWESARDQAERAARAILGLPQPPPAAPWVWSEQHGVMLQMAGLTGGSGPFLVRGDPESEDFLVFETSGGRAAGVTCVNRLREVAWARRMLAAPPGAIDWSAVRDENRPLRSAMLVAA